MANCNFNHISRSRIFIFIPGIFTPDDEGNKDQTDEAVDAEFKEVDDDKDK